MTIPYLLEFQLKTVKKNKKQNRTTLKVSFQTLSVT